MADIMTPEQRHRYMVTIKGRDTKLEMILLSRGLQFRVNNLKLSRSPDIVLIKIRPSSSLTAVLAWP
ncbi:MAG: very short patch repair endonuclease [Muribaculaceae bacterium]|nr:very short patch repair endonuclease [Muribaculaceae bacterium]